MQEPRSRKRDEDYEAALQQWRWGIRLDDFSFSERVDKFANFFRVARWVWLVPGITLACLFFVRGGTEAFPRALWLPAGQLLIIGLVAAYVRFRRRQETRRTATINIAEENGKHARRRIWRRDSHLSTRAYHTLCNFKLSKLGLTMYAAYVAFGGSVLILLNVFDVLEGRSTLQDTLRVVLMAYPGMLLTCCPIGAPAFLLWWHCRRRLQSWQRLEDNDPEQALSLFCMKARTEKLPDERDGAVIVPHEERSH